MRASPKTHKAKCGLDYNGTSKEEESIMVLLVASSILNVNKRKDL